MQIYQLNNLEKRKRILLNRSEQATTYLLQDSNLVLKIFSNNYLTLCRECGIDILQKLMYSEQIKDNSGIVQVRGIVVDKNNNIVGYLTNHVLGKTLEKQNELLLKRWQKNPDSSNKYTDLSYYAQLYQALETTIENSSDIVFPDLCTESNIIITSNRIGNTISTTITDYDGFQVGNIPTHTISTLLGYDVQYLNNPKYFRNGLFTKELDIKSLITLYLLNTFNINLSIVETNQEPGKEFISLDEIFNFINLDEPDIQQKIWKIFQKDQKNEYLGKDMFMLAGKYKLEAMPHPIYGNKVPIKILKK